MSENKIKVGFNDFLLLRKYLAINDYVFLFVGAILAAFTGGGLPHLVSIVGRLLNVFVMFEPTSDAFRDKVTPLLLYFVCAAVVLSIIAFLQFCCFRLVALKACRRLRRKYFRALLFQPLDYFTDPANEKANFEFEGLVIKLSAAITEALPAIVVSLSQFTVAMLISYHLSTELAIPITGLGIFVIVWFLFFNGLMISDNNREQKLNSKTGESLKMDGNFKSHCSKMFSVATRKSVYFGILVSSAQFFLFIAMGSSAVYGYWLIDTKQMVYPGYIFVVACAIIPASIKLGSLNLNFVNFYAARFVLARVETIRQLSALNRRKSRQSQSCLKEKDGDTDSTDSTSEVISGSSTPDVEPSAEMLWSTPELKRKQFLLTFLKHEMEKYPESPRPKNCSAFIHIRKTALKKKMYIFGFVFCLIFATVMPIFTKLNGDVFELYVTYAGKQVPFLPYAIQMAYKYLVCGIIICASGFICTVIYARNGEWLAKEIRSAIYADFSSKYGGIFPDSVRKTMAHMITKSANQCKSAFDSKLSTFFFGVFSLIFAVAFNMNKNVPTAFLCSVCFGLQAITQYFVFRTSEVHLKITMMEKNERAKIDYEKIKNMSEKEIGRNLEDIADRHDQYLYFAHHRKSLVVSTQALKFAFVIAIPQITQAISYVMGCFLLVEGLVRPIVVYKVIQTLYMSSFSVSTIAQFNMDVRQARLGALNLNDVIGEGEDVESRRTTSISSQSSTE